VFFEEEHPDILYIQKNTDSITKTAIGKLWSTAIIHMKYLPRQRFFKTQNYSVSNSYIDDQDGEHK
jgi:hypothetical protein